MAAEELTSLDKEKLVLTDEQTWDQSRRAEAVLEHILETELDTPEDETGKRMTVAEAIAARPVIDRDTGRTRARVLIVTTNEDVLLPNSSIRAEYVNLARQLDELHVMCLVARSGNEGFARAGDNIWFYQVRSKNWWTLPWAGRRAAREALTWNGVPRPDVIVGVDLFEAGLAARLIAGSFGRPLQYHVYTDPFHPDYKDAAPDNNWRVRLARWLLRRAKSVRVSTNTLKESLAKRARRGSDIAVLPRFYNFTALLASQPAFDLHARFPDYAFIMIAFGALTADSQLHDLFAALNRLLHNPRIGLVVVGDGPAAGLFKEKVKLLGIERSVVFHKTAEDLISYLKTADLMIEIDTAEEAEIRTLQAAAAGLPAVMTATALRRDLFVDGESAFLCEPGDLACISEKTSKFINTTALRSRFAELAKETAAERLHEDPEAHYQALALTIESVLIPAAPRPAAP